MKIASNWMGIAAWGLILAYFIWMLFSMHYRGRLTIQKKFKYFGIRAYVLTTAVQVIVLLIMIAGMLLVRIYKNTSEDNVSIQKSYEPLVLDTNGQHSYYVKTRNYNNSLSPQVYSYLTNGHREYVDSANSVIYDTKKINNLPFLYRTSNQKVQKLDRRYQRAWSIRIVAKYKDNWINGLGLRAGTRAGHAVLIRIPDNSFIYAYK